MFILLLDILDHDFHQVKRLLLSYYGNNDSIWREDNGKISIYYKDIPEIENLINNLNWSYTNIRLHDTVTYKVRWTWKN